MAGLVIKDLPVKLHRKLKQQAAKNHRSMTKELLVLLERALYERTPPVAAPQPFKGRIALTDKFIARARREGRA